MMTKQHKWHKEIKHWADGGEIEIRYRIWLDAGGFQWSKWTMEPRIPNWELTDCEFRIKPQPKESRIIREMKEAMEDLRKSLGKEPQHKEPQYLYVHKSMAGITFSLYGDLGEYIGKIKLEVEDGN